MNNFFSSHYNFMNEQKKMTVWAISKLLDGLKASDVKEILDCLQATLVNEILWQTPESKIDIDQAFVRAIEKVKSEFRA